VGGFEAGALASVEPTLEYHPGSVEILTLHRNPVWGHCQVGSLTGAVASQMVTEAPKGSLSSVGHRAWSVKAQGSLTARHTGRAGAKAGLSDPAVLSGRAVA
jgi:hypothetical protein